MGSRSVFSLILMYKEGGNSLAVELTKGGLETKSGGLLSKGKVLLM